MERMILFFRKGMGCRNFYFSAAFILALSVTCGGSIARCDVTSTAPPSEETDANVKPLDGIVIETVEKFPGSRSNQIEFGVSFYPFNAYYNSLGVNFGYNYRISQNLLWNVVRGSYFSSFQKDLTTELADKYSVSPKSIETLSYILSTNLAFTVAQGKLILVKDFIRYFRGSIILGGGYLATSAASSPSLNFGFNLEIILGDRFSLSMDMRDSVAVSGFNQYAVFGLGSTLSF